MNVNDLAEVVSVIGKLNRTIDEQTSLIDQYVKKFGPPQVAFQEEIKQAQGPTEEVQKSVEEDPERAKVASIVRDGLPAEDAANS